MESIHHHNSERFKNMELRDKSLFLFDMDGTIYKGNHLFPGVKEMLNKIEQKGGSYIFITNNSSKSVTDYVKKLSDLGIAVSEKHFFTSAQCTALYLQKNYPGKRVYCLGTDSLKKELTRHQITVTEMGENADLLLAGYDTELTYEKITWACKLLLKDIPYLATNPDWVCPTEFGSLPDCGAICTMLEYSVHRMPFFIGKPQPQMIYQAMEMAGVGKEETVVVGDRLYTDIASGFNAGVATVCVLCGESDLKTVEESDIKPDYIFDTIEDFGNCI